MSDLLAIIDGDVLAYNACRPRWQSKAKISGDTSIVSLDWGGKKVAPEFTKEEDEKYLRDSWENFIKDLEEMLEKLYCKEYLMAVKGPDNYRYHLYPEYKMNRHADKNKQNAFVPILRDLAVSTGLAVAATGREADDMLRIWANEARAIDREFIICSIDKDLKCIPGNHWLIHKQTKIFVTEEEATRFYYEQLLKGDPTDNIPGVIGIGDVKAKKALAPFTTETEFQQQTVECYMTAYGKEWKSFLLSNAKMIHLQHNEHDYFSFDKWPIVRTIEAMEKSGEICWDDPVSS
jgi:5'-3' exonuclease